MRMFQVISNKLNQNPKNLAKTVAKTAGYVVPLAASLYAAFTVSAFLNETCSDIHSDVDKLLYMPQPFNETFLVDILGQTMWAGVSLDNVTLASLLNPEAIQIINKYASMDCATIPFWIVNVLGAWLSLTVGKTVKDVLGPNEPVNSNEMKPVTDETTSINESSALLRPGV